MKKIIVGLLAMAFVGLTSSCKRHKGCDAYTSDNVIEQPVQADATPAATFEG